jgi:hypothetical protein
VRDLLLSASVAALGAATILMARTFPSGKTIEMQPGFYPQVLGILFGGDRRQALMTSLIATPLFYLVFRILFDVPLPRGLLEWL